MISIIIPVFNTSAYLDQCLQSVLEQSYTDWECILVDDGSTDNSGEICDKWAKKDSRFIIIHQKNQGVSAARNHGLERSNGEYICFIDSDDWVEPGYLEDLLKGLEAESISLVSTGNIHHLTDETIKYYQVDQKNVLSMDSSHVKAFIDVIGLFYGPTSKLYFRSIINEYNIRFPYNYSLGEDLIFNFSYLKHVNKVVCLPFSNYHYIKGVSESLTTKERDDLFHNQYTLWKIQKSFLQEKNMWNELSQRFFYIKLWELVHTGAFSVNYSLSKVKSVLSINEIATLKKYKSSYNCSEWMKFLIIHRLYVVIYLCNRFIKRRK